MNLHAVLRAFVAQPVLDCRAVTASSFGIVYAGDNDDKVITARLKSAQIAIDPPERELWAGVGRNIQSNVHPIWTCPGWPTFPQYEAPFNSWEIGYQYFGGIETWLNPVGSFPSRSTVKLNLARPTWCLAGEADQSDIQTLNCLPLVQGTNAACENDLPAAYTQLLGQLLVGRPGFQDNPCYETERNHYYASHCTCATRLRGPEGPEYPHLLRRFAHTNEGSCAIQVFWKPDEPVTMVRYHPGEQPALDVYTGRAVQSHAMPPAAGCTTNVEIAITDREDACMVKGHHNLLFCGDYANRFRRFAQLYKIRLAETGFRGSWPM